MRSPLTESWITVIDFFRRDIRKYAPRWGLAAGIVCELGVLIAWLFDKMPMNSSIQITPGSYYRYPIEISRAYDGILIIIPAAILAYLIFSSQNLRRYWTRGDKRQIDGEIPIVLGGIIGLLALWPVTGAGFGGIAIATPIAFFIILVASSVGDAHYYQVVLCCIVITLVVWIGETAITGSIAGLVYAVSIATYTLAMTFTLVAVVATVVTLFILIGTALQYLLYTFLLPERMRPQELLFAAAMPYAKDMARSIHLPTQAEDLAA